MSVPFSYAALQLYDLPIHVAVRPKVESYPVLQENYVNVENVEQLFSNIECGIVHLL